MQKALLVIVLLGSFAVQAQPKKVANTEVVEALPENQVAPQQVYVVQAQPAAQPVQVQAAPTYVRTQPVTVVEDTPLRESKADALRRSRVEVEQETETRIVEKLESERLKSEKERADSILQALEGKKKEEAAVAPPLANPAQQTPFQYPEAAQTTVVQQQLAPAPQVVAEPTPATTISAKEELAKEESEQARSRFFVGGLGGFADYPGYKNIQGKYAAGFMAGVQFPDRIIVQADFIFSRYDLEPVPYYFMDIKQTNLLGSVKYRVLEGRISPVAGVLAGYTRRTYSTSQYNAYYVGQSQTEVTSQAFDMGLSGGLAIDLSKNFALDVDFKYMFNLSYDVDSTYKSFLIYNQPNGRKTPEQLDYVLIGVGGKVQF